MTEGPGLISVQQIKPMIGALVRVDKTELLDGRHADKLRELLETRGVLVFPDACFTDAELVAFTRTLGKYAPDHLDGRVTQIRTDAAGGPSAQYTKASFFWHFDGYMNEVPILASILCPRVLSGEGGETHFCNTYAAWDALPEDRKRQIEGLSAVHALAGAQLAVEPEPDFATLKQWLGVRRNTLPLVWKHRSGRKSLVIGNTAVGIPGMDPLESLELLHWLRDWATQERFVYEHVWSQGDCVMWDNTGTLHRATPYDAESGRLMVRTKLAGEEPFA
ncbi:MAG: TauD/TfdA dioxygenase family protein [Novosphingobium sp.]